MNFRSARIPSLSILFLACAFVVNAQTTPVELEIGFRWLSVDGNEDMYRSQINEEEGMLLRSFSLVTNDFNGKTGLFDHLRIDASDLGAGPAGVLRIAGGLTGKYGLQLRYFEADAYSALPAFANPLLSQGIIPGQHTIDRTRRMLDFDLEFLPGGKITPFVGYSQNSYKGPGTTTYHFGQDEFLLRSDLDETSDEIRAGIGFNLGNFYGQVTQGWRSFDGDETLTLASGAGAGNNPGTVLDHPVTADQISRTSETNTDTPFTNIFVTGHLFNRARLTGSYITLDADTDGSQSESATGSFVSFPLSRYFGGFSQDIGSKAKNETSQGRLRAEVTIVDGIDFIAGYKSEHRELSGAALIDSVFIESITFGGIDRRDLEVILNTENALDRNDDTWDLGLSARSLGPIAIRATYSETKQDVTVSPDISEIVVPGSQSGFFDRKIKTFDLGGSYTKSGLTLSAAWRNDDSDDTVLRTDFLVRDRYKLRAQWTAPKNLFRIGVMSQNTDQSNNRNGIGYEAEITQFSGDIVVSPTSAFQINGSYSTFEANSRVLIRRPENFTTEDSIHVEDGTAYEGGFTLVFSPVSLDAGFGRFENEGTNPFDIDRYRARLVVDLAHNTGIAAEWNRDNYEELSPGLGSYDADRFGLFLRWHP